MQVWNVLTIITNNNMEQDIATISHIQSIELNNKAIKHEVIYVNDNELSNTKGKYICIETVNPGSMFNNKQ